MTTEDKLAVLSKLGRALNEAKVTWAVGASLMLYLNKKAMDFNDIDIMTTEQDAERVREILLRFGAPVASAPAALYKTACFLEFRVDGVDIDVIAGFVIVSGGIDYPCPFTREAIAGYDRVNGVSIPLQSMADWRRYYALMGRMQKVALIDG